MVETGIDHIMVDKAQRDHRVYAFGELSKLALTFCGKITTIPTVGAIEIASAFDCTWYIEPSSIYTDGERVFLSLAWKIPPTGKYHTDFAKSKQLDLLELAPEINLMDMPFHVYVGAKHVTLTVRVAFVSLVMTGTQKIPADRVVLLTRPKEITRMMTKIPPKPASPAKVPVRALAKAPPWPRRRLRPKRSICFHKRCVTVRYRYRCVLVLVASALCSRSGYDVGNIMNDYVLLAC